MPSPTHPEDECRRDRNDEQTSQRPGPPTGLWDHHRCGGDPEVSFGLFVLLVRSHPGRGDDAREGREVPIAWAIVPDEQATRPDPSLFLRSQLLRSQRWT